MILPLEILQNLLMGFRPVAKFAQAYHSTGLNADVALARTVFDFYSRFVEVTGKDVLEIGPGQTLEVLEHALTAGARSCTAVDIVDYVTVDQAKARGIKYALYDGKKLPFEGRQFDVIWSYTSFEHLRYPQLTVEECFRVLRAGGKMVALIDLGDHTFYGLKEPQPLKLFHCLQYSERMWNLIKWNRSSYVNRLRKSDWKRLVQQAGFDVRAEESRVSNEIAQALPTLPYLHRYEYDDAVTSVLTLCLEKPADSRAGY
jgi:SAM-dependent methyltransferase